MGDYTPEGMRELAQNNPKLLRCFDELAKEQRSQGQYKGGKGGEAQLLLESYDGLMDTVVRRGKIYPGGVVNQCLLGGIQPEVLSEIISSSDPTGLFARYNIASLPNASHYWDDDNEVAIDITPLLVNLYESIDSLPEMTFRLSPDAYQLFKSCHNHCESQKQRADKPAMIYQYGKMPGKILRWTMLYHILWSVSQGQSPSEIVEKKFVQIAKERALYQISQVKALLSIMDDSGLSKMFQLYQYALRKCKAITPRDAVYKTRKCKNRGEAIEFFRRLEEMGYGQTVTTSKTIKFEAFPERVVPATVTEELEFSNNSPEPIVQKASEVKIQEAEDSSNTTSNPTVQQTLEVTETSVTEELGVFEKVKNCQSREELAEIRSEYGTPNVGRVYQMLANSSAPDEVRQSQKIKLWLWEISLGGELKIGKSISLKAMGDVSQNTCWYIKSVESDCLWVEKSVRKGEQPEVRRVQFGDVRKIH
ncbi:MAG: DUF3987 domain-containing protein [Trichodesmium sp. MAG_R03]|nr:DUF3987 domain-containing protein [Trichodesmium sp. MAG_R03]